MKKLIIILNLAIAMAATAAEVRLEDLNIALVKQGWGTAQADKSVKELPMQMGGQTFTNGFGTHAPSLAIVQLDGKADKFRATVGVNDTGRSEPGSVEFILTGDGKVLFQSGIVRGGDAPKSVEIPLAGVKQLRLQVTDGGDNYFSDHANWAEAVISYSGQKPELIEPNVEFMLSSLYPPLSQRVASPGRTTYFVDPLRGDDAQAGTKASAPWKSLAKVNALRLAPGDRVELLPGRYDHSLHIMGAGTEAEPIVVRFAAGEYDFYPELALSRKLHISNTNDDPYTPKAIALAFDGVKHLRVIGGGADGKTKSDVFMHGQMIQTFLDAVEDVELTGMAFDYRRPTMSEYTVAAVAEDHADIRVHSDSTYAIKGGVLTWTGEGWSMSARGNLVQEAIPSEARMWRRGNPWDAVTKVEELSPRVLRLHFAKNPGLTVGRVFQIRNGFRNCVGSFARESKDITWNNCAYYYMHGLGLLEQFCENISLENCWFAPRPGSGRTCTAWADCIHMSGVKGKVNLTGCTFFGQHDDPLNIHGTYLRVVEKRPENEIRVRFMHHQTYGFAAFRSGDEVALVRGESLKELQRATVVAAKMSGDKEMILTLDQPLAGDLGANDVLENISWNPDVNIRNCLAEASPTYGFVLKTRGKILVEDCDFRGINYSSVALAQYVDAYWYESCPVHDVMIRNNRFHTSQRAPVIVSPGHRKDEGPVCANVRIDGNFFGRFPGAAVEARSVKGLIIMNNRFATQELPAIKTPESVEITIEDNHLHGKP